MTEPDLVEHAPTRRSRPRRRLPVWGALVLGVAALILSGWVVLRPGISSCDYSETMCEVEQIQQDLSELRQSLDHLTDLDNVQGTELLKALLD